MFKGIVLSVLSSSLFASLYFYSTLLTPLTGTEVFGWRMLMIFPFVGLFMLLSRDIGLIKEISQRVHHRPLLLLGLLLSAFLIGLQQWLFLWAPLNGRGLQVATGYFLLPLTMLLVGRFLYKESLCLLQKCAAFFAGLSVAHEIYIGSGFSWETATVALGFPCYFVLRRTLNTNHLGGFFIDLLFIFPFAGAVAFIHITQPNTSLSVNLFALLVGLAAISAISFIFYILASKILPLTLFGLLGNVEPVLLFIVAILLGESIANDKWFTYGPIWFSVILLTLHGLLTLIRKRTRTYDVETNVMFGNTSKKEPTNLTIRRDGCS